MPISKIIARQLENASWIRRMFEEGTRLKRERGLTRSSIFRSAILTLNRRCVVDALRRIVAGNRPGSHGYMPNPVTPRFARPSLKAAQRDRFGLHRRGRLYDGRLRGRLQRDPEVDSRSRGRGHRFGPLFF